MTVAGIDRRMLGVKSFATTSDRLAAVWDGSDRMCTLVEDQENGSMYLVVASGSGAACFFRIASTQTAASGGLGLGFISLELDDFLEVSSAGDVGNVAAIGGRLASDTTPILRSDAAESMEVVWAASNNDIIGQSFALPPDLDDTRDMYVEVISASGGTTNAASYTLESSFDGGALVADTITGAASTTPTLARATIAAADVPSGAKRLSLYLTPAAHTTDTNSLFMCRVLYFRK